MRKAQFRFHKYKRNHSIFDRELHRWKSQTMINSDGFLHSAHYQSDAIIEPLIFAGMTNTSLNSTCSLLKNIKPSIPSEETILRSIRSLEPDTMETYANQILHDQYQKIPAKIRRILQRDGILVLDFHTDPYYGSEDTPYTIIGQQKASTKRFFSYLTADIIKGRFGQTISILYRRENTSIATSVGDLLASIERVFKPKLILMDGEFASVDTCRLLINKGIQFIARRSITLGIKKYLSENYNGDIPPYNIFQSITYRNKTRTDYIVLPTSLYMLHGRLKALIISPELNLTADETISLYSKRFMIETGYRDKHKFFAPTCSRSASVRLILMLIACILWNIWQLFRKLTIHASNKLYPRNKLQRFRIPTIRILWLWQIGKRSYFGRDWR